VRALIGRIVLAGIAASAILGTSTIALTSPAWAATKTTCSGASGTVMGTYSLPMSFTGCTVKTTGGSGSANFNAVGGTITVSWANGETTNVGSSYFTDTSTYTCPGPTSTAEFFVGRVTGSTRPTHIKKGPFKIPFCLDSEDPSYTLAPGQVAKF